MKNQLLGYLLNGLYIFAAFGFILTETQGQELDNPTYIQWSGAYRSRFESVHRPSGTHGEKTNRLAHQIILSAQFQAQENLRFKASLLGFETWGSEYMGYAGYPYSEGSNQDMLNLYEAFAEWNFSSGVSVLVGRTPFEIGNGALFSRNMDDDFPTRFDGGFFQYQADLAKFQLGGFAISSWSSAGAAFDDKDYKTYFLNADLKILEPYVKNISLTFLILDRDDKALDNLGGVVIPKEEKEVYAVSAMGEVGRIFYALDGVIQQGTNRSTDQSIRANMLHAKVGAVVYEPWQLSLYAQYHNDTGDDAGTSDVDEGYDPLYYNHFQNAGKMNQLGWGNLTYFSAGVSWAFANQSTMSLEYNRFYRSSTGAGIKGLGPSGGSSLVWDAGSMTDGPYNNSLGSSEKFIGDEIDLNFELQTDTGLRLQLISGVLFPGQYLEAYGKDAAMFFQRLGVEITF